VAGDDQGFHLAHLSGTTPAPSGQQRPSRITPRHVAIGVLGAAVVAFVLQNTATTRVQLLVFSFDLPLWLVLVVLVAVSMAVGVLLGRRSARAKRTR
jgi:uncharacterized integral membrane protein